MDGKQETNQETKIGTPRDSPYNRIPRENILLKILNELEILYNDLNGLILQYDAMSEWVTEAETIWHPKSYPHGLLHFEQHLYVCTFSKGILVFNENGEIINKNSSLTYPSGIDTEIKNSLLHIYIADRTHVNLLNLKLECLSSWKFPTLPSFAGFRGLKVDGHSLYLTIQGQDQVFVCNSQDGKILNQFGNQLKGPLGVTVDNKYIYICDRFNHRVQILTKETGIYFSQWGEEKGTGQGQFYLPRSIYYQILDDVIYVGDWMSVQIFRKDGVCIQRLGEATSGSQINQFDAVHGICVMNDRLYISDGNNERLKIFKRSTT